MKNRVLRITIPRKDGGDPSITSLSHYSGDQEYIRFFAGNSEEFEIDCWNILSWRVTSIKIMDKYLDSFEIKISGIYQIFDSEYLNWYLENNNELEMKASEIRDMKHYIIVSDEFVFEILATSSIEIKKVD